MFDGNQTRLLQLDGGLQLVQDGPPEDPHAQVGLGGAHGERRDEADHLEGAGVQDQQVLLDTALRSTEQRKNRHSDFGVGQEEGEVQRFCILH